MHCLSADLQSEEERMISSNESVTSMQATAAVAQEELDTADSTVLPSKSNPTISLACYACSARQVYTATSQFACDDSPPLRD